MSRSKTSKAAAGKGRERNTEYLNVRLTTLPAEVREALAAAPSRSALVREALAAYIRAGPEREALDRLESKIDAISARLAALEAGGFVPAAVSGGAGEGVVPGEDVIRQAQDSFSAWCDD